MICFTRIQQLSLSALTFCMDTTHMGTIGRSVDRSQDTLYATMDDKMIVQYGWSVQRGAWEPLWDIEETQRERERCQTTVSTLPMR